MKIAIFTYSRQGCTTARKILSIFKDATLRAYTMERFKEADFLPIAKPSLSFYGDLFKWADAMIFVSSCGIAVREIAPHIRDKRTDPAVICIDDWGNYVIPILSGHIGGANDLAKSIADILFATPIITTATDIHNKFSVDTWATKHGFIIDSMLLAKEVSATILEKNIPLLCDFCNISDYPNGIVSGNTGDIGIYIGWEKKSPFNRTLRLIPPVLHLGIGCRKGTDAKTIRNLVDSVLETYNIDKRAIKCVASIDIKSEEKGLLEYCDKNKWDIHFYSADELKSVSGDFTSSPFVESITGVDNVCERAAMFNANQIVVRKTAANGVTVAIAAENPEVYFE